jgi:hypothetical protein
MTANKHTRNKKKVLSRGIVFRFVCLSARARACVLCIYFFFAFLRFLVDVRPGSVSCECLRPTCLAAVGIFSPPLSSAVVRIRDPHCAAHISQSVRPSVTVTSCARAPATATIHSLLSRVLLTVSSYCFPFHTPSRPLSVGRVKQCIKKKPHAHKDVVLQTVS